MKLDSKKYLSDIKYSIILIEKFIIEYNFLQYQNDLKTKSAVERQLGIIGEVVNNFKKQKISYISNKSCPDYQFFKEGT